MREWPRLANERVGATVPAPTRIAERYWVVRGDRIARSVALRPGRAHSGQGFRVATDRLEQALQLDPLPRPQDREDLLQDGGAPAEDGHDQFPARGRQVDDP